MLESQIENSFIKKLTTDLKYVYRDDIHDRQSLERNFREKFQKLNKVHLTDAEFTRLMVELTNSDVYASSKRLREINTFMREDGTPLQYTLVNIKDWCKNDYEVINQLRMNTRYSSHRYDVILLINGLPLVQIELKTLDVSPRRAMQQIVDYKNDVGNGYTNSLLCFMQMFIVSNRTNTYYFANNNRTHFNFNAAENYLPVYQWADEKNKKITNLDDFSDVFLAKCKLGEMISRYMVLVASEQKILMMRPYQIYAVKAIINCINENRGNGYIWHTTGSGKTLTSFKAATLLKDNPEIDKCLFVVDRKDLDRQTREEFNKFQEGCVEENTNTDALVRRMLSEDYSDKIIVTTIQKLGIALDPQNRANYQKRLLPIRDMRMVFIFDECHRSQFGENHKAIKEFFPNSQLFGFTVKRRNIRPRKMCLRKNCMPILSPMPLMIKTCCVSMWTILSPRRTKMLLALRRNRLLSGRFCKNITMPLMSVASMRSLQRVLSMKPLSITSCSRRCRQSNRKRMKLLSH